MEQLKWWSTTLSPSMPRIHWRSIARSTSASVSIRSIRPTTSCRSEVKCSPTRVSVLFSRTFTSKWYTCIVTIMSNQSNAAFGTALEIYAYSPYGSATEPIWAAFNASSLAVKTSIMATITCTAVKAPNCKGSIQRQIFRYKSLKMRWFLQSLCKCEL